MECPICYKNSYLISLPCTHLVCYNCLGQVLEEEKARCPMCRYQLLDIDNLMQKINENDPFTQCFFGYLYENGVHGQITIHVDLKKSLSWYKKASEQDNQYAQCNLAECYQMGKGTSINTRKAKKWYKRSAKLGNATSQYQLGLYYKLVMENYQKAKKYLRRASKQKYSPADVELGLMHLNGNGYPKNETKAIEYLKSAIENECHDGHYYLGTILESRGKLSEAVDLYKVAATNGYPKAMTKMGILHMYGIGVEPDMCKASFYFHEAHEDDAEASFCLGYYFETVKKLEDLAEECYDMACMEGYIPAEFNLGVMYEKQGDRELALLEYKAASRKGDSDALCNLGNLYLKKNNRKKATKLYKQSADQNNMYAQYNLGLLYELKGKNQKAVDYFKKSATQGLKDAIFKMGEICMKGEIVQPDINKASSWFKKLTIQP